MRPFVLTALLVMLAAGATAHGQQPVFSAQSELVVLHVTVRDTRGNYVTGLPRDAFGVVEDGRAQTVRFLADTDAPATVGLLIDSSGSMYGNRELVIAAAAAFAEASQPDDELFALAFNEHVRAALPAGAPFTSDVGVLRGALDRSINARGRTALHDAVVAGLDYLSLGTREHQALIVVSDGSDNASDAALEEVMERAQGSNAVIYTIALEDVASRDGDPGKLRALAEASGGEAFEPDRAREVGDVLGRIARDIRHTYTIGYVSTNTARDGAFRRVRVVVKAPDGERLVIRSRGGYLAGRAGEQ